MINTHAIALVMPVLGLALWTFVMLVWMYVTRIPAMKAAGVDLDEASRTGVKPELPATVTRVAENYNHLHEQPTLFYALALAGAVLGIETDLAVGLAWTYVFIRIAHSLVQATVNKLMVRFVIFNLGSMVLGALLIHLLLEIH